MCIIDELCLYSLGATSIILISDLSQLTALIKGERKILELNYTNVNLYFLNEIQLSLSQKNPV